MLIFVSIPMSGMLQYTYYVCLLSTKSPCICHKNSKNQMTTNISLLPSLPVMIAFLKVYIYSDWTNSVHCSSLCFEGKMTAKTLITDKLVF